MAITVGELINNAATNEDLKPYPNLDDKYGPYTSIADVHNHIPKDSRSIGLTVGVITNNKIIEYWYNGGIEDTDLVVKQTSVPVDLSNYYTKGQIDILEKEQNDKIKADGNKIKLIETNLTSLNRDVDTLKNSVGQPSRYTRARVKKMHIKIGGITGTNHVPIIAPLKYGASFVVSFTTDDASCSTLDVVWAAFNGRKLAKNKGNGTTQYSYHANQYFAEDIPNDILAESPIYPSPFMTYDIFGVPHRFKQGVAIWPYAGNKDGIFMDKESVINPSANNLYRFMTPFLMWEDCNLLKHYGVDFYWHNIGTEEYGTDKIVDNVIQGLTADLVKTESKLGVTLKCLARPDGNNVFITAMDDMPRIDVAVAENSPATDLYPYVLTDMYHKTYSRTFKEDIDTIKSEITTIADNPDPSNKKWYHFCCHTATSAWTDLLYWIKSEYGGSSDNAGTVWMATVGELYEYMYFRQYAKISGTKITSENGVNYLEFDLDLPYKDNFRYKDLTLFIPGDNMTTSSLTIDGWDTYTNQKIVQGVVNYDGLKVNAHIGIEENAIEATEYFIDKLKETGKEEWRTDSIYSIQGYRADLKRSYLDIINSIGDVVPITSIEVPSDSITITNLTPGTFTITTMPENNTHVNDVVVKVTHPNNLLVTKQKVENNKITYLLTSVGEALDNTITFSVDGISEPVEVYVNEENIAVTNLSADKVSMSFKNQVAQNIVITALPIINTEMNQITLACRNVANQALFDITSSISDNKKTFSIKNKTTEPIDISDDFLVSVTGNPLSSLVIPFDLHVDAAPEEVNITSITFTGPSEVTVGEAAQFMAICLPANNTKMSDANLQIETHASGVISKKSISNNILSFNITYSASGTYTVKIIVEDQIEYFDRTIIVNAVPSLEEDRTVCFVNWGFNDLNKITKYDDALYAGYINYNEMNYETTVPRTSIVNKNGNIMTGWERNSQEVPTLLTAAGLTRVPQWRQSTAANADLSDIFSIASETPVYYYYLYEYGKGLLDGWCIKVPNGKYKVRFLSSTTETADTYAKFEEFKLNELDILPDLPKTSLTNNKTWTQWFNLNVTNGLIWFYASTTARNRCGINAIEVQIVE